MKHTLIRLTLLMTLLLSVVLKASAHEEREVGTYILDFGWQSEPVYTGLLNGVELTIFLTESDDHSHDHADEHDEGDDHHDEDEGHGHDDDSHSHDDEHDHSDEDSHDHAHDETLEVTGDIPTFELSATVMDNGMVMIDADFTNFSFEPDKRDLDHVDGEGHGHFFIDGERDGYFFGEARELTLTPGEHTVMVTLHANSHEALTVGGEPLMATVSFTVPGEIAMSDEGHSHNAMTTVDGADLQVEITFGPASVTLSLVPSGQPGHYTANLIPTRPGDYTFRVFGTIGETEIDEVFTSADGLFDTVEPSTDIQFPPPEATLSELLDRIEALEDALNGE